MSILDDFKKFALRGNMVDLAVGFTVGAAFTTVVKSMVSDIIMPPIGLLTGNSDFADHFWVMSLPEGVEVPANGFQTLLAAEEAGAVTMNYGLFLNNCITLMIVAIAMFAIIRGMNRLEEKLEKTFGEEPSEPGQPEEKKCEFCRSKIPYLATRCPQCTSELSEPKQPVTA